ncbi:MAG: tetraacyldisaccharide 4'-kinase [Acidobacteria bacterium]|nr:tetraacyldisaccharide 4'-kinase [Acidobacteriota bacterium]
MNPLTLVSEAAVAARNHLYDRGTFARRKLSRPVISVGNLSTGGSGKTPFVILLGQLLKERGITFDVLSRGYGRERRGTLVVDPDGSARDFGDEPILIAKTLDCPVIVSESRYEAGVVAESNQKPELHLLDDGFQHRALDRDFDIVLLTPEDTRDRLLPFGRLREPVSSLGRADAVVITEELDPRSLPAGKLVWQVRRSLAIPARASIRRPVVFCGIARPHRFVGQLRRAGVEPVAEKFYRDHHRYTRADIRYLLELKDRYGADGFVSTQKDAMNLGRNYALLAPAIFPSVRMELTDPPDALDAMFRVINERRRQA